MHLSAAHERGVCQGRGVNDDERITINRELWTSVNAQHTDADARRRWASDEVCWGLFGTPERTVGALGDVTGLEVLDLACGTGYFSAWLARAGARPVGVDLNPAQLATARAHQREFGLEFALIEADAEALPIDDESFDLVVSEHGVGVWCDPDRWLSEAARVLRPTGRLVFLVNSVLSAMCAPAEGGAAGDRLLHAQRDLTPVQWPGGGVEFHLSHGQWIAALRRHGFVIEAMHELYAGPDAAMPDYYDIVTPEWASHWPAEELWVAAKP